MLITNFDDNFAKKLICFNKTNSKSAFEIANNEFNAKLSIRQLILVKLSMETFRLVLIGWIIPSPDFTQVLNCQAIEKCLITRFKIG